MYSLRAYMHSHSVGVCSRSQVAHSYAALQQALPGAPIQTPKPVSQVSIANACAGTTSCTVCTHPATMEMYNDAIEAQLHRLRFGCVCINGWSSIGFFPQVR